MTMNCLALRLWFFQWSCMDVRVGLWRKLSAEELMLLNCGVETTLESPLDCKEIQPVHSKGDQPWVFFGRNDAKAETAVFWPPHAKSWLIGKDSDAGRDWGQEKKGTTEDEMVGWHHRLDGCESEWTPGVGDGQGGLACCDSWGRKESDTTERLNWTELNWIGFIWLLWYQNIASHCSVHWCWIWEALIISASEVNLKEEEKNVLGMGHRLWYHIPNKSSRNTLNSSKKLE